MTAAPLISMLWESVDPAEALTKRFGFADAASALRWVRETLWDTWAIAVEDCDRLVMSDGNLLAWITTDDELPLIAKWSVVPKLFQRLAETTALTMWLHDRGIPVAAPIPARDGRLRVEQDNVSLGVFPVIDGDLLDIGDPTQVAEAGHVLARLHDVLAAYGQPIDGGPSSPGKQLVHNDYRSANLLHDGTSICAVLDFESVAYRTRIADLAQAMVLLGTRYHDWGPTNQLVREAFVAAYCDRIPLTREEQNELQHRVQAVEKAFGWA